jgi:hypothetical protein
MSGLLCTIKSANESELTRHEGNAKIFEAQRKKHTWSSCSSAARTQSVVWSTTVNQIMEVIPNSPNGGICGGIGEIFASIFNYIYSNDE